MKLNKTKKLTLLAIVFAAIIQASPSRAESSPTKIKNSKGAEFNLLYNGNTRHGVNYISYYLSQDESLDRDKDIVIFEGVSFSDGENCSDGAYSVSATEYALISTSKDIIYRAKDEQADEKCTPYIYIYATYLDCKNNKAKVTETIQVTPDDKGGFSITKIKSK